MIRVIAGLPAFLYQSRAPVATGVLLASSAGPKVHRSGYTHKFLYCYAAHLYISFAISGHLEPYDK